MKALANMNENSSAMNKMHLMWRLINLRMAEGAYVAEHLNEFNIVTTQLTSISINFDDEEL